MNGLDTIPLEQLRLSSTTAQAQRRKAFNKTALKELAESVKTNGIVQAILVRPLGDPNNGVLAPYEIVAGERRYLAAQMAGLERIPASVRDLSDEQVLELQLIENLQREDLHPMHEAESYDELVHKHGHSVDELFARIGKSRSYVYGRMKLLALSKACRKAFYEGEISASIAEKLARIPVESLQDEALEAVLGNPNARDTWKRREPMSYRDAVDHLAKHFMLDLSTAPFDVTDEKLNGAGACAKCPKLAGNQPELFGDVKKGNTCTDTVCFAAKTRAWGQRQIEAARKEGRDVLTGPTAKKVAPEGIGDGYNYITGGYRQLGDVAKKDLKPEAKTTLLQDPKSGRTFELVHESQIKKPTPTSANGEGKRHLKAAQNNNARAEAEQAVRVAVFKAIAAKGKWKRPSLRMLAELAAIEADYDGWDALAELLGFKTSAANHSAENYVKTLKTDAQLETFMAQAWLTRELEVSQWAFTRKAPRLEEAARFARVDVAKIRRELAPAKKASKKKSKS